MGIDADPPVRIGMEGRSRGSRLDSLKENGRCLDSVGGAGGVTSIPRPPGGS